MQENVADRPTMNSVVLMFNSHSATLAVPSKPAFFMHSTVVADMAVGSGDNLGMTSTTDQSQSSSVPGSVNEASLSELYPR